MKKQVVSACVVMHVLFSGGCLSYMEQATNEEAKREYRITSARADVDALQERVKTLESSQEKLSAEIADLKQRIHTENQEIRSTVAQMEKSAKAQEASIEQSRKEMVENLSRKIEEIMRLQTRRGTGPVSGSGAEHIVAPGETLSEIARNYGVSVDVLVKGNNITDPNTVRSGTKLIIPR